MAKLFTFSTDDSLYVVEDGATPAEKTAWSIRASQVAKHRPMFNAEMSAAQKARADAIEARFAPTVEVK